MKLIPKTKRKKPSKTTKKRNMDDKFAKIEREISSLKQSHSELITECNNLKKMLLKLETDLKGSIRAISKPLEINEAYNLLTIAAVLIINKSNNDTEKPVEILKIINKAKGIFEKHEMFNQVKACEKMIIHITSH